jgi:predicted nucleotide-binding protein (sugar kinase/HSP70/actin superfamily)
LRRLVKIAKKGYIWIMTDYLFARPSILEGIGRNIDLFGLMNDYNYSQNGTEADVKALLNDWAVVYGDLYKAYNGMVCQVEAKKTGV